MESGKSGWSLCEWQIRNRSPSSHRTSALPPTVILEVRGDPAWSSTGRPAGGPAFEIRAHESACRAQHGPSVIRAPGACARQAARAADVSGRRPAPASCPEQPPGIDPEPAPEVDERVAGDDRPMALDPEHQVVRLLSGKRLDTDVQSVARRVEARLADPLLEEPDDVGAAVARLLGGDAIRPHEVFCGIGQRRVDRYAEPSTRPCASRSCHGAVSTTAVSRSVASVSISLGGAIRSKSSRRSPSSIA